MLKQYGSYSNGRFTWKMSDPDREPGLARRYGVEQYGTIVLETKAKSEKVLDADEERLTNGLVKVTREGRRTVYFLQGHGEHDVGSNDRSGYGNAKAALERANYDVKELVLAREGKVPEEAAVVVLGGPRTDPLPAEIDALDAYLAKGGKLFVMTDPFQDEGVKRLLAKYGVGLDADLVIELNPIGRLYYGASTLVCVPTSLSQEVGAALGAQAGEAKLREVISAGGFSQIRRATETPFNMILEARP